MHYPLFIGYILCLLATYDECENECILYIDHVQNMINIISTL